MSIKSNRNLRGIVLGRPFETIVGGPFSICPKNMVKLFGIF